MGNSSDHVVEEATDHDEIGLWGFVFNFLDKYKKGVGREEYSEFSYLIMLIKSVGAVMAYRTVGRSEERRVR